MPPTLKSDSNGQQRKTLSSQLDRLDGILDGLDAALAGAVQEAVGLAVKEAVRTVLAEVLTDRDLQEQLRRATDAAEEEAHERKTWPQRLWQAAGRRLRQTTQAVRQAGAAAGLALLAAGGLAAGLAYAVRQRIASAAAAAYRGGKRLLGGAVTALTRRLPSFGFGGT